MQRLAALLSRGGQLAFEVEHLSSRGIWILTRADDDYPNRLKDRLRYRPPVLYGSGARALLGSDALAVVGSRDVDDAGSCSRVLGRAARSRGWPWCPAPRGAPTDRDAGGLDAAGARLGSPPTR